MEKESSAESAGTVLEVRPSESGREHILRGGDSKGVGENSFVSAPSHIAIDVRSEESNCSNAETQVSVVKAKAETPEKGQLLCNEVELDAAKESGALRNAKYGRGPLKSGSWDGEKVCRICYLSSDNRAGGSDLIHLGCGCKDELGTAHRHCAEAWFKLKGNRLCEVCGEAVKNVAGVGVQRFMEEWNERRMPGTEVSSSSSERGRCWQSQPLCNFLLGCLLIAFILPLFFRINLF